MTRIWLALVGVLMAGVAHAITASGGATLQNGQLVGGLPTEPTTYVNLTEEFMGGSSSNLGDMGWTVGYSAAGCTGSPNIDYLPTAANPVGVAYITTTAATNDTCTITPAGATGFDAGVVPAINATGSWTYKARVKLDSIANVNAVVGLAGVNTGSGTFANPPQNGFYAYFDGTNWVGKTCASASCTTTSAISGTGCTVDTNFHTFTISMNAAASSVTFQCDTATAQSSASNYPTQRTSPVFSVTTTTTAGKTLRADYMNFILPVTR